MAGFTKMALSVVALVGFAVSAAAPASAVEPREFPANDSYYAIPCSDQGDPVALVNRVSHDGTSTGVGEGTFDGGCYADGSYDVTDGYYYAYDWNNCFYVRIDIETGELTELGDLTHPDEYEIGCDMNATFVDQEGNHYLTRGGDLFSINLDDLTLTTINDNMDVQGCVSSIAYNPVDEGYYLINACSPGHLYSVDLADGSVVDLGAIDACVDQSDCWGLDFDSSGVLWIQHDNNDGDSMLNSTTLDDINGGFVEQGVFTDAETGGWYGESTFLIQGGLDELADTGFNPVVPLAIGGAIAATGLWLARRRLVN